MTRERPFADKQPQVLLMGVASRPEFAKALAEGFSNAVRWQGDSFPAVFDGHAFERAIDVPSSHRRWLDLPIRAIVLLQSRPGEWNEGHLSALRAAWPLARIAMLLGSWCEGEMRTGWPLAGVERIYWHQAARLPAWLNTAPPLPATATQEERLLAQQAITFSRSGGNIAIAARHYAFAEGVAEACQSLGLATVCVEETDLLVASPRLPLHGSAALLWHIERPTALAFEQVGEVSRRLAKASTPLVALLGFPRQEDRTLLLAAGARAIISLPMQLNDLATCLLEVLGRDAVLAEPSHTMALPAKPRLPAA